MLRHMQFFTAPRKDEVQVQLRGIFNDDQIDAIRRGSMRGKAWSEDTLKKGLQLRFACGSSGYQVHLDMGHPYPSIRCLQQKVLILLYECIYSCPNSLGGASCICTWGFQPNDSTDNLQKIH
jgi:hypothetical protein